MNWTTQKPTTSGWYWWRESFYASSFIVQMDALNGTVSFSGSDQYRLLKEINRGEWAGPLEAPAG